jgi:hypothetical protein
VLAGIESVSTEPLSLARFEVGAHTRRVPLEPPPEHVSYVEDTAVEASLSVVPAVAEQIFRRLEVAALGDDRVALRPSHVTLTLRGPQELLEELEPDAVVPFVELDPELSMGTHAYDVRVRGVPEAISAVTISPPSVLALPKGKP